MEDITDQVREEINGSAETVTEGTENKIPEAVYNDMPQDERDELNEILLNTQEQCQMMQRLIENQIEVKDKQIDRLHEELDYYRSGQAERVVEVLMKEVIALRQGIIKNINSDRWQSLTEDQLRQEFTYLLEDITDLLEREDIDAFSASAGEPFDAKRQKVSKTLPTQDENMDKKVAESVSEGYIKGDRVLVPERVIVYHFETES